MWKSLSSRWTANAWFGDADLYRASYLDGVAAAPPATIVCNMPAIRTSTTLPAAAEVPPAAARTVEVAVERAAAPAVTRETATLARQSARPARSSAPKAAAVVATDAIDIAAAPDSAQPTTGKAGAEKVGRAGGRS